MPVAINFTIFSAPWYRVLHSDLNVNSQ